MTITRRNLILGAGAASMSALPMGAAFSQAKAEFTLKYGNNLPVAHPMNVRATEMAASLPNTDVHFHLCVVDWVFEALPNALAVNFHVATGLDEAAMA